MTVNYSFGQVAVFIMSSSDISISECEELEPHESLLYSARNGLYAEVKKQLELLRSGKLKLDINCKGL